MTLADRAIRNPVFAWMLMIGLISARGHHDAISFGSFVRWVAVRDETMIFGRTA